MKVLLIPIMIVLFTTLVLSLEECPKFITTQANIPCRVSTTWEPPNACTTYSVTIFNQSGDNLTTQTLESLGSTGFCIFNFTYTTEGDYPYNITTGDTGNILVDYEDEMATLSVTLFILAINAVLFFLPVFVKFNKNEVLDNLIKKMVYILALVFLAFNTTIIVSLSENVGLGISTELFRYQYFFLWGIYIALIFLFWNMIVSTLKLWKLQKTKKRMGEE